MHAVRPDEAFRAPDRKGQARTDPLHTVLVLVMVMVVAAMVVVMVRQEGAREQRLTRDWWWWLSWLWWWYCGKGWGGQVFVLLLVVVLLLLLVLPAVANCGDSGGSGGDGSYVGGSVVVCFASWVCVAVTLCRSNAGDPSRQVALPESVRPREDVARRGLLAAPLGRMCVQQRWWWWRVVS